MAKNQTLATQYLQSIAQGAQIKSPVLTMDQVGPLRIAYAPFDHITKSAKLVIVGITPGETQAVAAIKEAKLAMATGADIAATLGAAKLHASFSGPMRNKLIAMLDQIGVADFFNMRSSSELFEVGSDQVHFTSALRYPVFKDGKNYNGAPNMIRTSVLRRMVETYLAEEARQLPKALWLPLGPKAGEAMQYLIQKGILDAARVLNGLPHPSGANAERVSVFLGRKKPEDASRQTNGQALVSARLRLISQIAALKENM